MFYLPKTTAKKTYVSPKHVTSRTLIQITELVIWRVNITSPWEKLCYLGRREVWVFRDLYAHYLALLAKQGWRLVKPPSSLLGWLFKARYFPHNDFWTAPTPNVPSACWKGIFEAGDLLVNGTCWQVW